MAASLQDMLNQMTGSNVAANPRRRQQAADDTQLTGGSQASSQSPGQSMLGSVLSNTLYQQLMPLLNTLNARRISNVITNDQYYNTPNNYTYTPGDTNPPPTDGGTTTGGTTTGGTGSTTFTPVKQPVTPVTPTTPTTPTKGPYDDLLNSIYEQEFGRAYNPSTDAWWAQQLQSGIENTSTAAGMNKLMQDISGGARNVTGGTQDLTYEQAHPMAGVTTPPQPPTTTGGTTTGGTTTGGGGTTTPATTGLPPDQTTSLLNNIYQTDFGRAYNPSTDSYWAQQIASNPSLASNPVQLANTIAGGAAQGSSDAAAYQKAMTVNPVTDNGKSINPVIPSGVGPGYVANLNAANADPAVQAALNGAVDANIPGFTVRRDGGPVHAHKTHPFYYHNGRWHHG